MKFFLPLMLTAILGCGLMAGLFFVFSVCVMKALGQLTPEKGITAMQSINVVIVNPVFLTVFMGTALASVAGLVWALLHRGAPAAPYMLAGSLLYLLGVIAVTAVVNVPMNDALAQVKPSSAEGAALWATYLVKWTMWNHVRTLTAMVATISFALALSRLGQQ